MSCYQQSWLLSFTDKIGDLDYSGRNSQRLEKRCMRMTDAQYATHFNRLFCNVQSKLDSCRRTREGLEATLWAMNPFWSQNLVTGVLGFAEKKIVGEREMMLEREEALRVIEGAMRSTLESDRRDRHALQTYGERFHSIETEMCESLTAETLLKTSFKSHGHFRQFDPEGQEFLSEMMAVSIDRMSSSDGVLITLEQVLSRDPQTHEIHITGKFNIQRKHMTVELETRYGFKHELKFLDLKSAIATETILNFYAEKFSEKPPTLDRVLKRDTRRVYNNTLRRRNFRRYCSPYIPSDEEFREMYSDLSYEIESEMTASSESRGCFREMDSERERGDGSSAGDGFDRYESLLNGFYSSPTSEDSRSERTYSRTYRGRSSGRSRFSPYAR